MKEISVFNVKKKELTEKIREDMENGNTDLNTFGWQDGIDERNMNWQMGATTAVFFP